MLFDLRGSGRRRTVKIVYITLAFLMGGGLVLFGIGGGGGISGGLVDAITERSGGTDNSANRFTKQEKAAVAKTQANPQDAAAWAALARARFQLAGSGENFDPAKGTFTSKGTAQLQAAGQAWDHYLSLNPKKPDDRVASLMVQAFGALNKPDKAAEAQEVITDARPTASTFTQLAIFAYQAGQTRKGDLAKNKALELTDPDMRQALKGQLEQAKQSAAGSSAAGQPSATP
jgi:hypothetical protein